MWADWRFLLYFYGLILVGLFFLLMAYLLKMEARQDQPGEPLTFTFPVINVSIPLPWRVQTSRLLRATLVCTAGVMFWQALNVDFSRVFPDRMRLKVFYDLGGVEQTLAAFTPYEREELGIPRDWRESVPEYDALLRKGIAELWTRLDSGSVGDTIHIHREYLNASGETTFVLERLGFLNYQIRESTGMLQQKVGNASVEPFWTFFTLRETPYDYIRPSPWQLLRSRSVILRPEFRQTMSLDARGRQIPFDHMVVAITKLRLVGSPRFDRTLYLWRKPNGSLIPIGYAIYSPS